MVTALAGSAGQRGQELGKARYQALADHLRRMSALENGRFLRETGQVNGVQVEPEPPRGSAEVARFFRPIDEWDIDRIVPTLLLPERPLNPQGVAVTAAELYQTAGRVYHVILDEAVDRFLALQPGGETRRDDVPIFDAVLAERLGFWSDLWRQAQDVAARDPSWRSPAVVDRSARVSAVARTAGPDLGTATIWSHIERMSELENGRFVDDALKRTGRPAAQPVDMARFREFALVVRFFRVEAEESAAGHVEAEGQ